MRVGGSKIEPKSMQCQGADVHCFLTERRAMGGVPIFSAQNFLELFCTACD
jgi:hypothetical protein